MQFARLTAVALIEDDADFRQALVERLTLEGLDVHAFAGAGGERVEVASDDLAQLGLRIRPQVRTDQAVVAGAAVDGRALGADVIAGACLIDRSGGEVDIGVPLVSLASFKVPAYPADKLPPELAALPAVKPGSRGLS